MLHIGFTGSRYQFWESYQLEKIQMLILNILAKNYWRDDKDLHIHIGDCNGVDEIVVQAAIWLEHNLYVYGLNGKYRNLIDKPVNPKITKIDHHQPDWKRGYIERDRKIVNHTQKMYAIWDGQSRGTKYTFEYAIKQGIRTQVATWQETKFVWTGYNKKEQVDE